MLGIEFEVSSPWSEKPFTSNTTISIYPRSSFTSTDASFKQPNRPASPAGIPEKISRHHNGGVVQFKLRIPHDKLEIYSTKGEFLCSYPVQSNGEVQIDDLAAVVYLLYLRGRMIVDMDFAEEKL